MTPATTTNPNAIIVNALFTCGAISMPVITLAVAVCTHPTLLNRIIVQILLREIIINHYITVGIPLYIIYLQYKYNSGGF